MSDPQEKSEAPELTPEARAVIGRARRSFALTLGIMVIGLITLGGAVVYRVAQPKASGTGADYVIATLNVPQGADVVSAVAADGKVTLTYRLGAMTSVRIFDGKSGAMIREIPVVSE